ncbi:MFS transporter [Oceanobacillus jeddahense]|uniref:MFS transporter n=1 Tax=Oceanobacillus jeddahense TaxID=1462527 RepID=UPI000595FEB5|nr:MFS transporter [Oceanobacillus jeddahense]
MLSINNKSSSLLAVSTFFFMIGVMGTRPLVPILTGELGNSTFIIGAIVSLFPLLPFFLSIHAGVIISKVGSRIPLLFSALFGAFSLSLPFLLVNVYGIVLSQIVAGVSYTFFIISAQSYIGKNSGSSKRDKNVMKFSMGMALGAFVGPTIGGFIADYTATSFAFLILSFLSLCAIYFTFFIQEENEKVDKSPVFEFNQAHILTLFKIKNFRRAMLISTLILTGKDTFTSFFPLLGLQMGMSSSAIGMIISINALAGILIRWAMPFLLDKFSMNQVVTGSIFFSGILFFVLPFSEPTTIIWILSFLLGLFLGLGQPLSISVTLYSLPKAYMSQGLGLRITVNRFVQITSPLLFGFIAQSLSIASLFYLTGFIYAFGAFRTTISETEFEERANKK